MKVMISACLLGENCKYNGGNNHSEKVAAYIAGKTVIPVCPEVLGGLPVPRMPCEIVDGVVRSADGRSFDAEYHCGAEIALNLLRKEKPDLVILQSRSPSCGVKQIYDGTFTGTKIPGQGVFAAMAIHEGIPVIDVEDL